MPDLKISQFTDLGPNQTPTDVLAIVQGGQDFKISLNDLFSNLGRNSTSKIFIIDGDLINVLKLGLKKNAAVFNCRNQCQRAESDVYWNEEQLVWRYSLRTALTITRTRRFCASGEHVQEFRRP
jgi:hypothetical protein